MSSQTDLHFSSETDQWATPQQVFDWLDLELGPHDLDAAADNTNNKCDNFIDSSVDALTVDWVGTNVWLNPPYGRGLGRWATKAIEEINNGHAERITILVPARTDTNWFIDLAAICSKIIFIKRRIRFGDGTRDAPFPSAVLVLESSCDTPEITFGVCVGDVI